MSDNKDSGNKSLKIAVMIAILVGAIILIIATERAAQTPESTPTEAAPTSG